MTLDPPRGPGRPLPPPVEGPARVPLADHLVLERLDRDLFRGQATAAMTQHAFGGEVAAQALVAAGNTVDRDRQVHSLHGYFLRPGASRQPIVYAVDRIRDGGSFTTRRVVALQEGEAIFHLSASFTRVEDSRFRHQSAAPDLPLPDLAERMSHESPGTPAEAEWRRYLDLVVSTFPLDIRTASAPEWEADGRGRPLAPRQRIWVRSSEPLGDDPFVHVGAATFASDVMLLRTATWPHGIQIGQPGLQFASLDHAVWFHEPLRFDDWVLIDMESTWAGHGRAMCRSALFDRHGTLVASVVQEGLVRQR